MDEVMEICKKYEQHKAFNNYATDFRPYYEEVMKLLPKSKKTLDLGCAYGILSLLLKIRGDEVSASDMADTYTNLKMLSDNNIKFIKNNIEKEDLPGKYDLITCIETIEHLNSNPLPAVKRMYDALNTGGYLFLATVMREVHGETTSMNNGQKGLWNDLKYWKDIPAYKGKWRDEHTFHYDQWNLITLVSEAGFMVYDIGNILNFSHYLICKKSR